MLLQVQDRKVTLGKVNERHMKMIILMLVFACVACSTTKKEQGQMIPVFNSAQKDPSAADTSRRAGDAEVFMLAGADTVYYCRMYRNDNNELRRYETTISSGVYDHYEFRWVNDSTVSFTLINRENDRHTSFQLMGSGASTSVSSGD